MAKAGSNKPVSAAQEKHGTAVGLKDQVGGLMKTTVALRRELHKWPEIGNTLPKKHPAGTQIIDVTDLSITDSTPFSKDTFYKDAAYNSYYGYDLLSGESILDGDDTESKRLQQTGQGVLL